MIVGCDPAGRRVAFVWPELARTASLRLPKTPKGVRATDYWGDDAVRVRAFARSVLTGVDTLWIERPIAGGSANVLSAIRIALTAGLIAGVSEAHVQFVFPMVWKAAVVGNGHASKGECREWLQGHHPALATACGADEDLVDAACIGLYGLSRPAVEGERSLPS